MKKSQLIFYTAISISLLLTGCDKAKETSIEQIATTEKEIQLNWTGCGITKKAFMKEVALAYAKETGIRINISGGGATRGTRFVSAGKVDLGGSCRHKLDVKEEENAYPNIVAWDALVVIVNPDNPVNNLTHEQFKDILTGKINNWKTIGGNDEFIQVVARTGKLSGPGRISREIIFGDINMNFAKTTKIFTSTGPMEKAVEKKKNTIGITGISSSKKRKVKNLKLNGVKASYENIASGEYPYFRPLYIMTKGKPMGETKKFMDYLLGPKGQKIIKSQGTVNLIDGGNLISFYAKKMKAAGVAKHLWR